MGWRLLGPADIAAGVPTVSAAWLVRAAVGWPPWPAVTYFETVGSPGAPADAEEQSADLRDRAERGVRQSQVFREWTDCRCS